MCSLYNLLLQGPEHATHIKILTRTRERMRERTQCLATISRPRTMKKHAKRMTTKRVAVHNFGRLHRPPEMWMRVLYSLLSTIQPAHMRTRIHVCRHMSLMRKMPQWREGRKSWRIRGVRLAGGSGKCLWKADQETRRSWPGRTGHDTAHGLRLGAQLYWGPSQGGTRTAEWIALCGCDAKPRRSR